MVLTLQNGFPEEKAKRLFPEKNLMGGSMEFSATFKGPGVTELASGESTLGLTFGSECARVIEAAGVKPVELFGLLPSTQRLVFESDKEKHKVREYWLEVEKPFRRQIASMLQDIRRGRKCEIGEINGEVARMGNLVGVETPYNKKMVDLVTRLEAGVLSLERAWENLREFEAL